MNRPNMQNIPKRTEQGDKIREAFTTEPLEKHIAKAIMDAIELYKDSYHSLDDPGFLTGEYKRTMEDCLIETCKSYGLPDNLWALLNLAMHWINDIQLWCEDVLAGRNVLDQCQTCKGAKTVGAEPRISGLDTLTERDIPCPRCYPNCFIGEAQCDNQQ